MTLAERTTVLLMSRSWIDSDYVKVITKLKLKVELIRSVKWTASFGSKNNAEIECKIHQNLVLIIISERFCLYSQYSWFVCFVYPSALLYCIYPASAAPCWCCTDFSIFFCSLICSIFKNQVCNKKSCKVEKWELVMLQSLRSSCFN